jgi:hypothetical protein
MNKLFMILLLISFSILGFTKVKANVNFHCYSVPNMPVQTYEYGSTNCEPKSQKPSKKKSKIPEKASRNIGADGPIEVLCVYQAACMPVSEAVAKEEPPAKDINTLTSMLASKQIKSSVLICLGEGRISGGEITSANCPSPSQCRRDIFYNFISRSLSPGVSEGATVKEVNAK